MRNHHFFKLWVVAFLLHFLSGCATFKSELQGKLASTPEKNYNAKPVDVCFVFSHYRMVKGMDVIPKLENQHERIDGFDDLFLDAMKEFSNIKNYDTYTNYSSDVNDSKRRQLKDSLISKNDFLVDVRIVRQKSFPKHFFAVLGSSISATVLPMPYKIGFSIEVNVFDHNRILVKAYKRNASITKWVETFMIFLYPFYPQDRVREELYVEFLHDIFKQIESEKTLKID
ncbi:MAG: hypothetical protein M0P66_07240 [Salinivirgaceae bacterium]|nr:hypothetical protein [Salinivirgaceae bacterium]